MAVVGCRTYQGSEARLRARVTWGVPSEAPESCRDAPVFCEVKSSGRKGGEMFGASGVDARDAWG